MRPDPILLAEREGTRSGEESQRSTTLLPLDSLTPVEPGKPPKPAPTPEVGAMLGRYQLLAWQGVGSASHVFRSVHPAFDIPVAVKVVNRDAHPDPAVPREHLRTEARLLARLNHPYVVRAWDFHDDAELPYLITEYVPGPTLAAVLRRQQRLTPRQALRVVAQTAEALAAIWRAGVVHRDVKPANLILCPDGTVKLLDLGLAAPLGQTMPPAAVLTSPASWAGTPAYLAPEQAQAGAPVDHRADIYSLGVTFYEAVTGRLPFAGTSSQVVLRHRAEEPPAPDHLAPDVPPTVSALILRMMANEPAQRFDGTEDLRCALEAAMGRVTG
jgi:serine/threonine protein kinase